MGRLRELSADIIAKLWEIFRRAGKKAEAKGRARMSVNMPSLNIGTSLRSRLYRRVYALS